MKDHVNTPLINFKFRTTTPIVGLLLKEIPNIK